MAFWNTVYKHVNAGIYVSYPEDPKKHYIRDAILGSIRQSTDLGDSIRGAIIDRYAGNPNSIYFYAKNHNALPEFTVFYETVNEPWIGYGGTVDYGNDPNCHYNPLRMTNSAIYSALQNAVPSQASNTIAHYQAGSWDMHFAVIGKCPKAVQDKYFATDNRLEYDIVWRYTNTQDSNGDEIVQAIAVEHVVDPVTGVKSYQSSNIGSFPINQYKPIDYLLPIIAPTLKTHREWDTTETVETTTCTGNPQVCTTTSQQVTVHHVEDIDYPYLGDPHIFANANGWIPASTETDINGTVTNIPASDGSAQIHWNNDVAIPNSNLLQFKAGTYPTPQGTWTVTDDDGFGQSPIATLEGRGTLHVVGDVISWFNDVEPPPGKPIGAMCVQVIDDNGAYHEAFQHVTQDDWKIPRNAMYPDVSDPFANTLLPIFPIMKDKSPYYEWKEANGHLTVEGRNALILSRRLNMPGRDVIRSLKDNEYYDDFTDVQEGYIANIFTENTFVATYVYAFFNELRKGARYGAMEFFGNLYTPPSDYDKWLRTVSAEEGILGGGYEWDDLRKVRNKSGWFTPSELFKSIICWDAIEVATSPNTFAAELLEENPRHTEIDILSNEAYVIDEYANDNNNNLGTNVGHQEHSHVRIRQAVPGTNFVKEIHIFNLKVFNGIKVDGSWRVSGQKVDDVKENLQNFLLPVSRNLVRKHITPVKEMQMQIMYACTGIAVTAVTITYSPWWKEKLLPVLVGLIVIVSTLYGMSALAQALTAGLAAGTWAILQMILIKIAFTQLSNYLIERFPGTFGEILGAIALIVGDMLSGTFDGSSLVKITTMMVMDAVQAVQKDIDNQMKRLQDDEHQFEDIMKNADASLDKMYEEVFPGATLDPTEAKNMAVSYAYTTVETAGEFLARTLIDDPGDTAIQMTMNYEDIALQEPRIK